MRAWLSASPKKTRVRAFFDSFFDAFCGRTISVHPTAKFVDVDVTCGFQYELHVLSPRCPSNIVAFVVLRNSQLAFL